MTPILFEYNEMETKYLESLSRKPKVKIGVAANNEIDINNENTYKFIEQQIADDSIDVPKLKGLGSIMVYAENEPVFLAGDKGRFLYIIIKGRAVAQNAAGEVLAFLEDGDIFGEMSVVDEREYSAMVRTVEKSTIFALTPEQFKKAIIKDSKLALKIIRSISSRLELAKNKILDQAEIDFAKKEISFLLDGAGLDEFDVMENDEL